MVQFLWGAIMMACFVAALFFFRFYRDTSEKFFRTFGLAFFLLAIERIILVLTQTQEVQTWVYVIRLVAFIFILFAIIEKNTAKN